MGIRGDRACRDAAIAALSMTLVVAGCGTPLPTATARLVGPPASGAPSSAPVETPSTLPTVLPTATAGQTPPAPTSPPVALPGCPAEADRFPVGYTAYHTYAGLCRALVAAAEAHSDIARLFPIGRSWQGRTLWAMEISTHLADGTHPPGVLFDGLHHGL